MTNEYHDSLYNALQKIRPCPALYLGRADLELISAFISGYLFHDTALQTWNCLSGFTEYCIQVLSYGSTTADWCGIIKNCFKEEAVDRFFRLLDDFLDYRQSLSLPNSPPPHLKKGGIYRSRDNSSIVIILEYCYQEYLLATIDLSEPVNINSMISHLEKIRVKYIIKWVKEWECITNYNLHVLCTVPINRSFCEKYSLLHEWTLPKIGDYSKGLIIEASLTCIIDGACIEKAYDDFTQKRFMMIKS